MAEVRRGLRRLGAVVLSAALGLGPLVAPAHAADLPSETAYRQRPNAQDAEAAARHWLGGGNLGRALNWIERMVRSPGATEAQRRWAEEQRQALQKSAQEQGFGRVAIQVLPTDALVEMDGRELSPRSNNHLLWLKEGPHLLRASAPGHRPLEREVPLSRGEVRKIDLKLQAIAQPRLQILVDPPAQLWVDGKLRGEGQRLTTEVTVGQHTVELRAAGYANFERTLSFGDGEVKDLRVQLQALGAAEGGRRPVASNVDRPVLESEKNSDPLGLSKGRQGGVALPSGSKGGADLALPGKGSGAKLEAQPKGQSGEPDPTAQRDEPSEPAEVAQSQAAPDEPWSDAAKGWLLAGPGLALLGGGAAVAMLASAEAEKVNQRPYGDANYDADYDAAGQRALIGYATAAAGAGLSAWGSWYLLAKRGIGPTGRGALLAGTGAATLAAGAWLWLDAGQFGDSASSLPAGHPDIARREELNQRNQLISYAVAGTGAALVGLGAWQYFAGSAAPTSSARAWQMAPLITPQHAGAMFALQW